METVIGVLLIVMGIFLIISVLMQSSKDHRLSGSIAGGAETFFGKQKGKTLDALFTKLTTVVTIIFSGSCFGTLCYAAELQRNSGSDESESDRANRRRNW